MKHDSMKSYPIPLPLVEASDRPQDVLTEILRKGAQDMLGEAVRDEVARYLAQTFSTRGRVAFGFEDLQAAQMNRCGT